MADWTAIFILELLTVDLALTYYPTWKKEVHIHSKKLKTHIIFIYLILWFCTWPIAVLWTRFLGPSTCLVEYGNRWFFPAPQRVRINVGIAPGALSIWHIAILISMDEMERNKFNTCMGMRWSYLHDKFSHNSHSFYMHFLNFVPSHFIHGIAPISLSVTGFFEVAVLSKLLTKLIRRVEK